MRQAFLEHRDHMSEAARTAMDDEFTAASRETEEALIWMLPWLGDDERAEAIRILAQLREIRPEPPRRCRWAATGMPASAVMLIAPETRCMCFAKGRGAR